MLDGYDNRWALVTGASSGIGAEFAARLAGRGMHLILAARRADRMNALAEDLVTKHGTKCHIVAIDLSAPDAAKKLAEEVERQGVRVELLVNNAGVGMIGAIETTSPEDVQKMLALNISTLTDLTYRLLPGMLERGHGAIINVASVAAFQPVAYTGALPVSRMCCTSAKHCGQSPQPGVTVMALCPGVTQTEFFNRRTSAGWKSTARKLRFESSRQQ
ncbi:MAG: SDR family NAD(P)-dependent oxidoreductase [Planctomycetaceae bacterium]